MRFPAAVFIALVVALSACSSDGNPASDGVAAANADSTTPAPATGEPPPAPVEPVPDTPDDLTLPAEGPPVAPEDPSALAALITAAEDAVRDPARPPEELAAAGHWQQVAYRRLVQHPEWVDTVMAQTPEHLHGAVLGNVVAGQRLAAMHAPADPSAPVTVRELPPWRIVAPPPADELKAHYEEAEAATGVHWSYLAAVNLVETRMGRIRGDSVAGAQGPMQFMPATWAEWGEGDIHGHRDAIMAAARFLRWGGMPGDVNGALFRYNRDVRYVDAVRIYAEQMQGNPRAFYGYYHWQVYYYTGADSVWLPAGYGD